MATKVPSLEVIDSVLNKYFSDTEVGGTAEQDEQETVYIYDAGGKLRTYITKDVWFELLTEKEEREEIL